MAFVEQEDILHMFEGLIKFIFRQVKGIEYTGTVERTTWEDAMFTYGIDKPDIRFGMQVANLKIPTTGIPGKTGSGKSFSADRCQNLALACLTMPETVVAISVPGAAEYTRKQVDELTDWVKRPQIGMQGLVYVRYNTDGSIKSSADKFFNEDALRSIATYTKASPGDLILFWPEPRKKPGKQLPT
jgi:aspartyl-tRNA synthetase